MCGFIEEAKWHGLQTAKINHTSNYSVLDTYNRPVKIWKESEKSTDKRIDKIVKDKTKPAEGDYDTKTAWKKTQLPNREYTLPLGKLTCFTEKYSKSKKNVPAPNLYKVETQVFSRLSLSPLCKAKRH